LLRSPCSIEQWLDSCEEHVGENFAWNGEQCDWPVAATGQASIPEI